MSEKKEEQTVSVEMTNMQEHTPAPDSEDTPYVKGDMWERSKVVMCSRFDPEARARAANMTSYVAMTLNIALTIIKVSSSASCQL